MLRQVELALATVARTSGDSPHLLEQGPGLLLLSELLVAQLTEAKQLEAGDSAEAADEAEVVDAEVEAVEAAEDDDDGISEAELLEHFKSLEKNAEA